MHVCVCMCIRTHDVRERDKGIGLDPCMFASTFGCRTSVSFIAIHMKKLIVK